MGFSWFTRLQRLNMKVILAAGGSFLLASGFVFLVFSSAVSLPSYPSCANPDYGSATTQICVMQVLHYEGVVSSNALTFWTGQLRLLEVALGFCFCVVLARLGRRFNLRKALSAVCVVSGLWFYFIFVAMDTLFPVAASGAKVGVWASSAVDYLTNYLNVHVGFGQAAFGMLGFLSLLVAGAGVMVFRIENGLWIALKDSVLYLAAPAILVLEVMLLLIAPDSMSIHVTDFTSSVPFLNNWVAFGCSLFLTVLGFVLAVRLLRFQRRTRAKGLGVSTRQNAQRALVVGEKTLRGPAVKVRGKTAAEVETSLRKWREHFQV